MKLIIMLFLCSFCQALMGSEVDIFEDNDEVGGIVERHSPQYFTINSEKWSTYSYVFKDESSSLKFSKVLNILNYHEDSSPKFYLRAIVPFDVILDSDRGKRINKNEKKEYFSWFFVRSIEPHRILYHALNIDFIPSPAENEFNTYNFLAKDSNEACEFLINFLPLKILKSILPDVNSFSWNYSYNGEITYSSTESYLELIEYLGKLEERTKPVLKKFRLQSFLLANKKIRRLRILNVLQQREITGKVKKL